jgi:YHS domain-containing protein
MPNIDQLLSRIDAAFSASKEKVKSFQTRQAQEHHDRQQRLEKFDHLLEQLRDIWRSRLEAFARRFGEKVKVTPSVAPGRREATFGFDSELAHIDLRFSVFTDADVRNIVFHYDLQILPILMKFDSHAEIEFPLDSVDTERLAQWIDDRIISFVNTYLSLHENAFYLKGHMVQDPIAKVQFPRFAAGAIAEFDGKKYYFVSEETCRAFANQRRAAPTSPR